MLHITHLHIGATLLRAPFQPPLLHTANPHPPESQTNNHARNHTHTFAAGASDALPPLRLAVPQKSKSWVVGQEAFGEGVVGAKALNLAKLGAVVPEWIQVGGVFGCCGRSVFCAVGF